MSEHENFDAYLGEPSVPADAQIKLMSFPGDKASGEAFLEEVGGFVVEVSRLLDLSRLDGITIGSDIGKAICSIDLGYVSEKAQSYTDTEDLRCVGKVLNVIRPDGVRCHVVYDVRFVFDIIDPDRPGFSQAQHILVHELGHVAEHKEFDEAVPGVLLKHQYADPLSALLTDASLTLWQEYAACRMVALVGDPEGQKHDYSDRFLESAEGSPRAVRNHIKAYRKHADTTRLLEDAGTTLMEPLRMASYLLGHLDGLDFNADIPEAINSGCAPEYVDLCSDLHKELRRLWDIKGEWSGIEELDGLNEIINKSFVGLAFTCI